MRSGSQIDVRSPDYTAIKRGLESAL